MKLYLSSYRLGNDPQKLVDLVGKNKKTALIANAMDYHDKNTRDEKVREGIASLKELVYAAYSAGICVLAPSLKGSEIVDDPYALTPG